VFKYKFARDISSTTTTVAEQLNSEQPSLTPDARSGQVGSAE
jgi:hypothetical protein